MRLRSLLTTIGVSLLAAAGLAAPASASETVAEPAASEIIGGQEVYIGGNPCLTGFTVRHVDSGPGFVTAGFCGEVGDTVTTATGGSVIGVVERKGSAGWLWVDLADGVSAAPLVAPDTPVHDAEEAPIGATVCKYTDNTGSHCGVVREKDVTIDFPEGAIHGVTGTDVCAEPGDSGAPFMAGNSGQGVTLGGSGSCDGGDAASFFYPLSTILAFNSDLELLTA